MDNPSNKDIMKTPHLKLAEVETSLNFNGEIMEELQRTIKAISHENRDLTKKKSISLTELLNWNET
nr:unnamed protein product [Callosobruchus chinensis]CAH7767655.1 unnamed protein product [Callosobruchus chinensis]